MRINVSSLVCESLFLLLLTLLHICFLSISNLPTIKTDGRMARQTIDGFVPVPQSLSLSVSPADSHKRGSVFKYYQLTNIAIESDSKERTIVMNFTAFQRNFILIFREDFSGFSEKAKIVTKSGSKTETKNPEEMKNILTGSSVNDGTIWGYGSFLNSVFDGVVHTVDEIFYVEPRKRYFPGLEIKYTYVIYRHQDVYSSATKICNSTKYESSTNHHLTHLLSDIKLFVPFTEGVKGRKEYRNRLKRNANTPISCSLKVVADHLFFIHIGQNSVARTVAEIVLLVKESDGIFRSTDFDGDAKSDNVGFVIKDITIYTDTTVPGYKLAGAMDAVQYLEAFSEYDFSEFCLAVVLTYRDFQEGVVGLAWVGSSSWHSFPGGICQPRIYLSNKGKSVSFNSAMTTFINNGARLPRVKTISTLVHEFGHSFGSPHDSENDPMCAPGGSLGNFIMYPYTLDGSFPNNRRFSMCSLQSINPVLTNKGQCLINHSGPICGNGLVETGEECDCGTTESCSLIDHCCTPSNTPSGSSDSPCTIRRHMGYMCSPKVSLCCTESCQIVQWIADRVCREETDCSFKSVCDGSSANCPYPGHRSNGTACHNNKRYCHSGECQSSLCKSYGLNDCMCVERENLCSVCCTSSTGDCELIGSYVPELRTIDGNNTGKLQALPGQPCKSHHGYCTTDGHCLLVDPDSTLIRFSEIFAWNVAQSGGQWFRANWFYVILAVIVLFLLTGLFLVNQKFYENVNVLAKRTGKLTMLLHEAERQKQKITEKLERYDRNDEFLTTRNKLDRVVAISRLIMLFPTLSSSEANKVSKKVTNEEVAVRYLLLRGYPMMRTVADDALTAFKHKGSQSSEL